jgi:hypothetical protein
MRRQILAATILASFGTVLTFSAQAATLNSGDVLTITQGVGSTNAYGSYTSVTGSWFGIDENGNGTIGANEKGLIGQGTTGLVIGTTTTPGASHAGAPTAGDTNAIDAPWMWNGNTGSDYVTTPVTGSTTTGLNMSGWSITWNGAAVPMGTPLYAWGTGFSAGIGNFVWDGIYGHAYTLDYHVDMPPADPSCLCSTPYALHLEGTVTPVPVPAAIWLLGSGLAGVAGVARRRKAV